MMFWTTKLLWKYFFKTLLKVVWHGIFTTPKLQYESAGGTWYDSYHRLKLQRRIDKARRKA